MFESSVLSGAFVPSADILQISLDSVLPRRDRLFRAAISAFCSLTRPGPRDAAQLDDLALPLLPLISEESRRFAAAALSETFPAPPALLRRLADYPVSVSAPLLVRSRSLADIDLIGLIGRNGVAHARAIGRRANLNPNIAALVRALGVELAAELPTAGPVAVADPAPSAPDTTAIEHPTPGALEEETRDRLRSMMAPVAETAPQRAVHRSSPSGIDWVAAHAAFPRMVATGLSGVAALFQTAIADAFAIRFDSAREIVEDGDRLATALKAAGFGTAEAFFITALAFPPRFGSTVAIRSFVEDYRRLDVEEARRIVSAWREQAPASPEHAVDLRPANSDGTPAALLRAS